MIQDCTDLPTRSFNPNTCPRWAQAIQVRAWRVALAACEGLGSLFWWHISYTSRYYIYTLNTVLFDIVPLVKPNEFVYTS